MRTDRIAKEVSVSALPRFARFALCRPYPVLRESRVCIRLCQVLVMGAAVVCDEELTWPEVSQLC